MKTFACINKNETIRINSSSGGVFSLLAENVLLSNGIVYGVSMTEDCYSAEFIRVSNLCEIKKLRGSKYFQAKIGNSYKRVKQDLIDVKIVLFTGTGCQINGLISFLKKDYANLICVDMICHGVPSPALWEKYAKFQEKKHGKKIESINFRCKDESWNDFGIKENNMYISKDKDLFMQLFLNDYCLRPSCYYCVAKKNKKSDITIADFWGIENLIPQMNDGKGTSLVIVRTEKGNKLFDQISSSMIVKNVEYKEAIKYNPSEYESVKKPMERKQFYKDMNNMKFENLAKKYLKLSLKTKVKRKLEIFINHISKKEKTGGHKMKQNSDYGLLFTFNNNQKNESRQI